MKASVKSVVDQGDVEHMKWWLYENIRQIESKDYRLLLLWDISSKNIQIEIHHMLWLQK